jgi:hypothetical protein
MNEVEQELSAAIYTAVQESMHRSDRSAQAQQFRVGVSDLGFCSERLRRFLAREVPKEKDMLEAFIGTWLGEGIEQAVKNTFPEARVQSEVVVKIEGDQGTYLIPGHPDIVLPERNILLDVKSAYGLEFVKRKGFEDTQKRYQRHLYGFALIEQGVLQPDAQVGNLWIDRSGKDKEFYVRLEPFSMAVVAEATEWLDQVVYSWQQGETAAKEPPRELCAYCGFFESCRGMEPGAEGLLTAPEVLTAIDLQVEANALERQAKRLKAQAKDALQGVSGNTGKYAVKWVHVAGTDISYHRGGYDRLTITPLPTPAKSD